MRPLTLLGPLVLCFLPGGCDRSDGSYYTLYRNSVLDSSARIHVASFDTREGDAYNQGNCRLAADLFAAQPDVKTRVWCEKDAFDLEI